VLGTASDYLAAERTFLAWLRTGIALMGLGFVLARFGIFLQEFNQTQVSIPVKSTGASLWIGVALILLGASVCALAAKRHVRLLKKLESGDSLFLDRPRMALGVAAVLILLGLVMAGYLIFLNPNGMDFVLNKGRREMATVQESGILRVAGHQSVPETVARLKGMLDAKGVKLFTIVDHSGEAENAGLKMPNTKLLIFGNPKAGTPIMLASPSAALDLPLKILVTEDSEGMTWISYNAPVYLKNRHEIPGELMPNLAVIEGLVAKAAE